MKGDAESYNAAMSQINLTNHFLIAMPAMTDPFFAKSLTYVCEHNDQGAMGIVVNRPISLTLSELFAQINMPLNQSDLEDMPIHFGGPGADRSRFCAAQRGRALAVDHAGE